MILEFIETDEQWHNGVALEEYNGKISIVRAYRGKDGEVYVKWGFPEKKKAPVGKAIPWKIELGSDSEAAEILTKLLQQFGGPVTEPVDGTDTIPF